MIRLTARFDRLELTPETLAFSEAEIDAACAAVPQAEAEALELAAARIRDSEEEVFGELRVTTTTGFGSLWLAPRLPALYKKYPDLKIDLMLEERVLEHVGRLVVPGAHGDLLGRAHRERAVLAELLRQVERRGRQSGVPRHEHDAAAKALRALQELKKSNSSIPDLSGLEKEVFGS